MSICLATLGQFDRNFDGLITISDIWGTVKAVFYVPSSLVIEALHATGLGRFFELSPDSCESGASFLLSIVSWLVIGFFALLVLPAMGYSDAKARSDYGNKKRDMGY